VSTPANFATSSVGVVDTGGKFAKDTCGKFANDTGGEQWEQYQAVHNLK
jgi:hypothetical protein